MDQSHQRLQRIFIFVLFAFACLLMVFYVIERQELTQPYVTKIRHAISSDKDYLSMDMGGDNV